MSREIAKAMTVAAFHYIDRTHRAKLAIGCPSIHMTHSVTGFLQEGVSGDATP
jgi:hypothetical protein